MTVSAEFKMTWSEYFGLNSTAYNKLRNDKFKASEIKERVKALQKNFYVNDYDGKKLSPYYFAMSRHIDVNWIEKEVIQDPILSRDTETKDMIESLKKTVAQFENMVRLNQIVGFTDTKDGGSDITSSYSASVLVEASDSFVFDGHVHLPDYSDIPEMDPSIQHGPLEDFPLPRTDLT